MFLTIIVFLFQPFEICTIKICPKHNMNKYKNIFFNVIKKTLLVFRLISRMFEAMSGNFAHPEDIRLFVNVINGSLALHPEVSRCALLEKQAFAEIRCM